MLSTWVHALDSWFVGRNTNAPMGKGMDRGKGTVRDPVFQVPLRVTGQDHTYRPHLRAEPREKPAGRQ